MNHLSTIGNMRFRYIVGLSAIALLITASFITMQRVVSEQRGFSSVVNLAGHQAGLANRIAYFASLMATTADETEFNTARGQVGRTIHKIRAAHKTLRKGDVEKGIPLVTNDNLLTIYDDPMVGLDLALTRFLERAEQVYHSDMESLDTNSAAFLFLSTYGPHVLEPLLDAAVDEYATIGRRAILRIERFELIIWLAAMITLLLEIGFIFRPLERHVQKALNSLENSVEELTDTRKRLLEAQKLALVGDWEFDATSKKLTWSDQVYDICGVEPEVFSVSMESSLQLVHPEDQVMLEKALREMLKNKITTSNMEYRVNRPDGKECLVYQHAMVVAGEDGQGRKLSGTIQDITERKTLSTRLEKLSQHIPGFIFQYHLDSEGNSWMPYTSIGIADTCGLQPEEVEKDSGPLLDMIHKEDLDQVMDTISESREKLETWRGQFRLYHPKKGMIWLEGHATPEQLINGNTLWYGYIWDVTDRKQSEDRIRKLALYDPLTGLANRRLLKDRLSHAIATSRRNQYYGAVLMLDLDNFKSLNDTKGHNVGDALLIEVAKRLVSCVRETDTVSRLGGDEFVVVLEWLGQDDKSSRKKALEVAEKIRIALGRAYVLEKEEHLHHTSASIGVSLFKDNEKSESELLKHADVAMYEAKDLGRNRVCLYSQVRQAVVNSRSAMAHDMKLGLDNDEFSLYLQPQVLSTGGLSGAEALLRWFPEGKDPVSPGSFIPIAENTGLILPLGEWVMEKACKYIIELESLEIPDDFALSINISARQFMDELFLEKVQSTLKRTGIEPNRLKFELTETCLVQDLGHGQLIINALREMGVRVELDDFGTGYSSLNSINTLPLTALKIDRSLIHGIGEEDSNKAIVRAAIAMAKAMSMLTIAEGVESLAQQEFLIQEGCDVLQGFLFARPMPYDDFTTYLERFQSQQDPGRSAGKVVPFQGDTGDSMAAQRFNKG